MLRIAQKSWKDTIVEINNHVKTFFTICYERPQLGNSITIICDLGYLCHKNDGVWTVVVVVSKVFAIIIALDNVTSVLLIAKDV